LQRKIPFGQIVWPDFFREVGRQSWLFGRWILLAFLLEALMMLYVPQENISSPSGSKIRIKGATTAAI
jgi:hypothetical protein